MAARLTAFSDPIAGVDDSTTNTTEPSELASPCKRHLPQELSEGNTKCKPLPSELPSRLRTLDEHQLLKETYLRLRGGRVPEQHRSLSVIPRFYSSPPGEESTLAQKLREEARSRFLKERSTQLLDNHEVSLVLIYTTHS